MKGGKQMAEKPRGNIFYEIGIVLLIVCLIAAILYPSRVWEKEKELEDICRARMDAIQQLELSYLYLGNVYTDTLSMVKPRVLADDETVAGLDTMIMWDRLVRRQDLKKIVSMRQFPEDLRGYILDKLIEGRPIRNLSSWDSLEYRLLAEFVEPLNEAAAAEENPLDALIDWKALVGENQFWWMIERPDIPRSLRIRARQQVNRGRSLTELNVWERYYRSDFYGVLQNLLNLAMREDIWEEEDKARWEEAKKAEWDAGMDMKTQAERDSIWNQMERRFWDKEKEVLWKADRPRLWRDEGEAWKEANVLVWERAISQNWQSDRKKSWEEEVQLTMSDSAKTVFRTQKDSLWRAAVDSIREAEYQLWQEENTEAIDEVIENLWERERRMTWEGEARAAWLVEKESDQDALWKAIKEEIWNQDMGRFWREEEQKVLQKKSALKRLDAVLPWNDIVGEDEIRRIVDNLKLPDNDQIWKAVFTGDEEGSALNRFGIVGLFRDVLLDSVNTCPVTHTPYIMNISITEITIPLMTIACPIVDTADVSKAFVIDPVTKDSTFVTITIPTMRKIFGGASISNHGNIDEDGKKSWEKKGR